MTSERRPRRRPAGGRPSSAADRPERPASASAETPDVATFQRVLTAGAAELGLSLAATDLAALTDHYLELLRWRRRADLTSITGAGEIALRHFVDSLVLVPLIPRGLGVADLGSGGGFPGVPLAVARPDLHVTLLDARELKVAFLDHLATRLARPNLAVRAGRAEQLATQGFGAAFDAVVARAVSDPASTVELAFPLLAPGGQLWLMRGPEREDERFAALVATRFRRVAEHAITLPIEHLERRVLLIERS